MIALTNGYWTPISARSDVCAFDVLDSDRWTDEERYQPSLIGCALSESSSTLPEVFHTCIKAI
jgi:hypothetical protein